MTAPRLLDPRVRRPAGRRHHRRRSPDALTALGLKLETIERPGARHHRPAGDRPGADDRAPSRRRTARPSTGAPSTSAPPTAPASRRASSAARTTSRVGDLVVVVLPGGVLPGDFEISARKTYGHVSAGMICSAQRARPRRRPRRHHRAARRRRRARRRRLRRCCGLRDEVIEFEINPDRAYALSLRGVAREAALALRTRRFRDPADRDVPAPNADGYPVEVDDPAGCPVFVARTVTGFDPAAPTPTWLAPPAARWPGCARSRWPSTSPTT